MSDRYASYWNAFLFRFNENMYNGKSVADPGGGGGRGGHGPPSPVKTGHKKDGRQRQPHRFHVSRPPPLPGRYIRY